MKELILFIFTSLFFGFVHSQEFQLIDTWDNPNGSAIEQMALSPDGEYLLVGDHSGTLSMWNIEHKSMVKAERAHYKEIKTILFNESNTRFITAGEEGYIGVWKYPSMEKEKVFNVQPTYTAFAVFSPNETEIYFGGLNYLWFKYHEPYGALQKINFETKEEKMMYNPPQFGGSESNITDGNYDYERKNIVFTKDRRLVLYDPIKQKMVKTIKFPYNLNAVTYFKDKIYLFGDKMLMKVDNSEGDYKIMNTVLAGTHDAYTGYSSVVVSSDGKLLVTGDDDFNVNIWDAETMVKKQILFGHTDIVRAFTFCRKDTVLFTGGYDGKIMVWSYRPEKKEEPIHLEKNEEVVFAENNVPLVIKDRGVDLQANLPVSESEFDIQIWDKAVEDGDSISLNLNGEWILKDHLVTRAKKKVHIKLNTLFTNNYLILYAHNLGSIPPNTAAVAVVIGGKEVTLSLTSDMKKSGALNFEYKPN